MSCRDDREVDTHTDEHVQMGVVLATICDIVSEQGIDAAKDRVFFDALLDGFGGSLRDHESKTTQRVRMT